ncbi:MAG: YARHG domain-containing protein [Verrucomicrobia bacterium]|nr:YARHG domain-containing protein [Verrucomicrobiota bacterium]
MKPSRLQIRRVVDPAAANVWWVFEDDRAVGTLARVGRPAERFPAREVGPSTDQSVAPQISPEPGWPTSQVWLRLSEFWPPSPRTALICGGISVALATLLLLAAWWRRERPPTVASVPMPPPMSRRESPPLRAAPDPPPQLERRDVALAVSPPVESAALPVGSATPRVLEPRQETPAILPPGLREVERLRRRDGRWLVLAPDSASYSEASDAPKNALYDRVARSVVATLPGPVWVEAGRAEESPRGYLTLESAWAADGQCLLWQLGGKWEPAVALAIWFEAGSVVRQLDVLAATRRELQSRVRQALPRALSASESPDAGFTLELSAPPANFRFPLRLRVRAASNPKELDDFPAQQDFVAECDVVLEARGALRVEDCTVRLRRAAPSAVAAAWPGERFPQTRLRALTDAELASLGLDDIRYALNEMMARHGMDFREAPLRLHFSRFAWWRPEPGLKADDIEYTRFTPLEQSNFRLLGAWRNAKRTRR